MLDDLKFNLQMFADGDGAAEGGDGSSDGEQVAEISGETIPSFIPEKARANYEKAMVKMKATSEQKPKEENPSTKEVESSHVSYEDLIKSDEYKEEHKAYMDKTIGNRLKKYKGMEDNYSKAQEMLNIVASKYGVDINDENFLETLKGKIDDDDSYYEQYALDHDMTPSEARRIVTMERKVQSMEAQEQAARVEEENRARMQNLLSHAEQTKAQFPGFDLETEMQDEKFRRLCAANGDDTTAAYMACHWNTIIPNQVQMASQAIQSQTAKAVAANKARPSEAGLSSRASTVVEQDFRNMNLQELRAYADEQRRKMRR